MDNNRSATVTRGRSYGMDAPRGTHEFLGYVWTYSQPARDMEVWTTNVAAPGAVPIEARVERFAIIDRQSGRNVGLAFVLKGGPYGAGAGCTTSLTRRRRTR